MTSSAQTPILPELKNARFAVSTVFFLLGVLFATWVSRIPAVSHRLQLNEAELGIALLGLAVGALLAFPVAGWATAKYGSKIVTTIGVILMALSLPLIPLAPNMVGLTLMLVLLGVGNGGTDVAMNSQAVDVEKEYQKPIMSSFHALYSVGGIAGSLMGGLMASLQMAPLWHFGLVTLLTLITVFLVAPKLLNVPGTGEHGPVFALPSAKLLGLGVVIFCVAVGEGAMADWSAIYLKDSLSTTDQMATAGYLAFSGAMVLGRVFGDSMRAKLGAVVLVGTGALLSAAGLLLGLIFPYPWAALLGFACVGWGLSSGFPVAFSAAGNVPGVHPSLAMAAIATMGYTGFLLGPPIIGFVAHATTLTWGLGLVVVLSLIAAAFSRNVKMADVKG
ncbi:MFS transporter [Deinococcus cellulosilyticus]|uniref:MFS transporter n=1 Tax=Deinococcus cellulosilyticus (strain DSM 18568 / NBRC 106333 / KACC 11606 / 5516J-15) TaxID=1223518 RepID=A0A511MZ44_DEIC1|nr:MFS transporter [Deinococcus cellulosilyticus]GEM45568.1 MFS transporter [Deinococcus cellulosilyticus NBRC 106333 = KACC 11606]